MWNDNELNSIYAKIDSYRDNMIELQKNLTAIPAIGPKNQGQGETKKADFLKEKWTDGRRIQCSGCYCPDRLSPQFSRPLKRRIE